MRAAVVCLIGVLSGSAESKPLADVTPPARIMRCVPMGPDGFRPIGTLEIFRSGQSDLGLFVVTSSNGSATTAFVRLSFPRDSRAPYLQAIQATRATDIGFTFLARLGASQEATLRTGQADLRFACDSAPTLATR